MKNIHVQYQSERINWRLLRKALLIFSFLLSSIVIQAQILKITISEDNATVEALINEIRNQSNIDFIYNHEELMKCPKINAITYEGTIEEVLNRGLENTGMTFRKINNTIIITPDVGNSSKTEEIPEVQTQTIKGTVTDRDSKITLPFANVVVLNTTPVIGATTDVDGNFFIDNLPVGRYALQVSYVGYEDAVLSEILLGSAKEVVVSIELTEALTEIGEIMVSVRKGEALNDMATVSAKSFSVEETKRYAASIGDPARMAQAFAGVSTSDDASNEIVIRGNSPNWMLWRLEGVEIPSPNHFAEEGYSAGAVSILNTNTLGTSDFYTGAFPGEYGNALSGVFDIKLRNGNYEKNEYAVQVGVLGIDLAAEGPFKKGYRGSYLLNYRYSTFSLLNALNIQVSENALPSYQDLSFKVNLPTKKAGTFSLWGIGGLSIDDQKYLPDTTLGYDLEDGYTDYTKTGMYATGLSHTIFPDQKSYVKTVISHSNSYSSETYDQMDSLGVLYPYFYDDLQKKAMRFSSYYNRKISKRLTLRTGGVVSLLNYDYLTQNEDTSGVWNTHVNSNGETSLYQAYLQGKYKFSDKVVLTAGAHYTHFALSRDNVLEPRLGMLINLPKKQKLSFGYGMHSRHENLPVYFVEFENDDGSVYQPNLDLELTRASHFVLGYEVMLGQSLNTKVELYYQDIKNLPVSDNPDKYWSPAFGGFSLEDTLANIGRGRNYGIELSLQKYFTNNYYFIITSSLFEAKYQAADGQWRNSKYNVNYINNFVGGKEINWGENKMLGINGKVIWSGGKRLIPIDYDASVEEGEAIYDMENIFSKKGSDYFRIDLGVKLHFFKAKTEHIIAIDIQNLTNRLNTWTEFYNPDTEAIEDYPMAGLIPIISYRIEF